jgi:hypothetical protein
MGKRASLSVDDEERVGQPKISIEKLGSNLGFKGSEVGFIRLDLRILLENFKNFLCRSFVLRVVILDIEVLMRVGILGGPVVEKVCGNKKESKAWLSPRGKWKGGFTPLSCWVDDEEKRWRIDKGERGGN